MIRISVSKLVPIILYAYLCYLYFADGTVCVCRRRWTTIAETKMDQVFRRQIRQLDSLFGIHLRV